MLKVGLTGGIASGKSTVDRMLVEMGAFLVDTDQLSRRAVAPGAPALAEIAQAFGPRVIAPDGSLDRGRMRELAFGDARARARLDAIVHPKVAEMMEAELARLVAKHPRGVAVIDVPLLFESGWQRGLDRTVLVYIPCQEQLARLMARDGCTRQQAETALGAQMPLKNKRALADFLVDNSGGLDETLRQVKRLWQQLIDIARATDPRS
ncbi:MAG: dephospho-CoA kinase [Desulfarculaceae bacterium]|nr:dephospho-CoA kinase [Desulfarculaceae bacterium]MCF8070836.1 dephospho-CoA kinase [Desulfarculaceae bacterium]MCF8102273.1 dephospho-CoA kinase [Desulfarculaceae bacterium]MCF8118042.1 dephospho-CoA kinase [Desulfarculaceae bacterium]